MKAWIQKRPLLLWGCAWSVYFELMWLLWRGKLPHSALLVFYILPPLWTLLLCVRPAVACGLRVAYGLGIVAGVVLPLKTGFDSLLGMALGGGCMGALVMEALMRRLQPAGGTP